MPDLLIFLAGCFISSLCAAFVVLSAKEMRRLGDEQVERDRNATSARDAGTLES